MNGDTRVSHGAGVVVLAAYRPDPELFGVQLRSIRDQTRRDFRCLVGADGGQDEVRRLVDETVGDDPRFEVIGWDDNVGFYLNFERLLRSVPDDATWVALSDQDDRWYPEKLERLVPLLDDAVLATGQARAITWPGNEVVLEQTDRRVVPAADLLLENQVTGSTSVFRRDLLATALPFPRWRTVTQLHDHWLGLCAAATGGYVVADRVVQDYVQHGGNLVGEQERRHPRSVLGLWRLVTALADEYEGAHDPLSCARASQALSFGWRREMARVLAQRVGHEGPEPERLSMLIARPGARTAGRVLRHAWRSTNVRGSVAATFVAGTPGEVLLARHAGRPGLRAPHHDHPRAAGVPTVSEGRPTQQGVLCWLCGAQARRHPTLGSVGYWQCSRCAFVFQADRDSAEDEAKLYDAAYFEGYNQRTGGRAGGQGHYDLTAAQRMREADVRLQFVRATEERGTLLEVGAASGYFVAAASAAGFQATGIEPSSRTAADARERGIPVRVATLADIASSGEQFDVVCAWHVLEHLPEPRVAIEQFRSVLRPGGRLFLELPNVGSVAALRRVTRWAHLDPEAHVAHYTPSHVDDLLGGAGLEITALETFSVRLFSRSHLRRLLNAAFDSVLLRTPGPVHPTRHELIRVAARRPLDSP